MFPNKDIKQSTMKLVNFKEKDRLGTQKKKVSFKGLTSYWQCSCSAPEASGAMSTEHWRN